MDIQSDTKDVSRTKALYEELTAALAAGYRAAVRTEYRTITDAGKLKRLLTDKRLITEAEQAAWQDLETKLYGTGTGFMHDGPVSHRTAEEDGLGVLTVVERYAPKPRLLILGGGHIALALVRMAKLIEFSVTVFDDRPMFANPGRFPEADEVICDDFSRVFERLNVRSTDYVVIVTRGHKHDTECLEGVLRGTPPTYIGMIGSRRRVAIVLKQLRDQGFDEDSVAQVHSPIGLAIGAVTPAEISVSIISEIIEVKRKGKGLTAGQTCETDITEWLAEHGDEADALITILTSTGSVPRETGAKMAINYQGNTSGTIGGGCAEGDVIHRARTVIREGGFELEVIDMTDTAEEDGMVCGGTLTVVIEKTEE
jgi:xanthine dehydrogenase accessory factor